MDSFPSLASSSVFKWASRLSSLVALSAAKLGSNVLHPLECDSPVPAYCSGELEMVGVVPSVVKRITPVWSV